jgi:hypothetical protein
MKKYVVAVISFFENDIQQFKVEADNEYEAVKKGVVCFTKEKYRKSELEFQNSEEYPTDVKGLEHLYNNAELDFSVMEVGSF